MGTPSLVMVIKSATQYSEWKTFIFSGFLFESDSLTSCFILIVKSSYFFHEIKMFNSNSIINLYKSVIHMYFFVAQDLSFEMMDPINILCDENSSGKY